MQDHQDDLAGRLDRACRLSGRFVLRSGQVSAEYFDKYLFESDPAILRAVATEMCLLVPAGTEVLCGLELGGVPLATAMSLMSGLPSSFVRKRAKPYGTAKLAEGPSLEGRHALVVEDVVTSGGQVAESANALRELGATVTHAICAIDRQQGGAAALSAAGIALLALFDRDTLDAARTSG
ncbi:MAG: orotate phosphoribosyltransferase [Acidimicrobiales bacterium]